MHPALADAVENVVIAAKEKGPHEECEELAEGAEAAEVKGRYDYFNAEGFQIGDGFAGPVGRGGGDGDFRSGFTQDAAEERDMRLRSADSQTSTDQDAPGFGGHRSVRLIGRGGAGGLTPREEAPAMSGFENEDPDKHGEEAAGDERSAED